MQESRLAAVPLRQHDVALQPEVEASLLALEADMATSAAAREAVDRAVAQEATPKLSYQDKPPKKAKYGSTCLEALPP